MLPMQPPPVPLPYLSSMNATRFPGSFTAGNLGSASSDCFDSGTHRGPMVQVASSVTAFVLRSLTVQLALFPMNSVSCLTPATGNTSFEQNPLFFSVRNATNGTALVTASNPVCLLTAPLPLLLSGSAFTTVTLFGDCYLAPGFYVITGVDDGGVRATCGPVSGLLLRLHYQYASSSPAPDVLNAAVVTTPWHVVGDFAALTRVAYGTSTPKFELTGFPIYSPEASPPPVPPPSECVEP